MPTEPQQTDIVSEARELLETHSIVAMRVDKPYKEIRPLIAGLCDEVERLREHVKAQNIELESLRYSRMFGDTHVGED